MRKLQILLALPIAGLLIWRFALGNDAAGEPPAKTESASAGDSMMAKCMAMMQSHQAMKMDAKAADAELDRLLIELNGSTGDKKIEAMAAIINRLVSQRKSMQDKMADMQAKMMQVMMDAVAKPGAEQTAKPKAEAPPPTPATSSDHAEHQH